MHSPVNSQQVIKTKSS